MLVILKVEEVRGKQLLTRFQQQKFRHFFYHVLDLNSDHVISQEDFDGLNDRVRHYMDWSVNTLYFLALREVGSFFSLKIKITQLIFSTCPGAQPFSGVLSLDCIKLLSPGRL